MNTPLWTRKTFVRVLFAATGVLALGAASAQDYPTRTIRIVTPYDPGSMVDATTRIVADELSKKLGQPVIVENKAGGLGMVAMNALLAAPADGYTLLTDTPASAINPTLNKARYNPKTDIAPIAQFMKLPFVIAASPNLKVKNAAELVALAKKDPGSINIAVAGTSTGLVGDLFALQTGTKFLNVPYKGAGAATLAVLKNEAQLIFLDSANLGPHISEGKLTGLLVTGDERAPNIKDVPTAKEAGFAAFDATTWFGMFARAGVPQDVQKKLNAAVREVMASPRLQEYLKSRGATGSTMTNAEFSGFFHKEVDRWAEVIKKADIKGN
jgi:tripartite-type tricarboxylate transporter receptor subunit TctC